jgi:hypothetical protein
VCTVSISLAKEGIVESYFAKGVTGSNVFPIHRIGCEVSPLISSDISLVFVTVR